MPTIHWKAAGLQNLTDARYFNALDESWIGFNFDVLSSDSITLSKAAEIMGWLFEPRAVAAFGLHQTPEEIAFILGETGIPYVEVEAGHAWLNSDQSKGNTIIRIRHSALEKMDIRQMEVPVLWVLDLEEKNDFSEELKHWIAQHPVIIKTGANAEKVKSIYETLHPLGFELELLAEERPGWSAVDIYDEVIEQLTS